MDTLKRTTTIAQMLALTLALLAMPAVARAQDDDEDDREQRAGAAGQLSVPVTGTATAPGGTAAAFTGNLTITRFERQGDRVLAVGTLVGSVANGATVRTIATRFATPVQFNPAEAADVALQQASCDILRLVLGPLNLDLLGLNVQLNRVVLDITAVPGPGNLLGNLLCSISGLLDGSGSVARLVTLLNQLLALLG
jgi:hypothetical protein